MSIEKLSDCSKVIRQRNPFTQISNEVILNIKDNDAFRVYAYLQSKSAEWKVIKEDVQKMCDVGQRKLDYIFSYLARANLIRYVAEKDDKNKFIRTDIHVLNGLEFNKDEPFLQNKDKKMELSTEKESTPALSAAAETRTRGNAVLLNKDITKEKLTKREYQNFEKSKPSENRSTVKFWEPGNPDYDRVNGIKSHQDIRQVPIIEPELNLAANWG